ncbi:MAG: aminotransferase class V-fold PLP-dependent enzyme [Acutalibacteraceae bacterium]|nr:aminotransferase class V-fold PLP-dependent enzyme [Acutalibacteraceae bacterium]
MIYLDNSATTFPKPKGVYNAVNNAMQSFAANPGRSGHKMSITAAERVFECRRAVAKLYNIEQTENIVFTPNCTYALNTVINGYLKENDHVVVSQYEHNSVLRPLKQLESKGITYTAVKVEYGDSETTLNNFRNAINSKTRLFVITHASNVTGVVLPVSRLIALAHQYNIKVLVDTAQSSGVLLVDATAMNIDFLAAAGHKGLFGPMGTGVLYIKNPDEISPLVCGGTGSSYLEIKQPDHMPDKFESGTCNLTGICGLLAGVEFVRNTTVEKIYQHEFTLLQRLYEGLSEIKSVKLYTPYPETGFQVPVLSFNIKDIHSEEVAAQLSKSYSIAVRAGLHCAPLAHKALCTENQGTVRASLSYFNNIQHINALVKSVQKISR